MFVRAALILFFVAGCGRALTETEAAFAARLQGDQIDLSRVRLVQGPSLGSITFRRDPRPRVTCRERIIPPPEGDLITTSPAAVTLFNTVMFSRDWYLEDYLPGYPDRLYLVEAMLLAHELTHVWQWQNRARTGYSPLRAAAEQTIPDPYLFDLDGASDFLDYGYEQQSGIVEEYVCCRALDPLGARTKRLHALLGAAFPVADLPDAPRESDVYLPWKGAEPADICA